MSQEVIDIVLNACDVKHITSNFKSSTIEEKEEKKSLLESLLELSPQECVIIDEKAHIEKSQYHSFRVAETLGLPVPENITEQLERIPFDIPRKDHIGYFSKKPTIKSCSVSMKQSVFDYIVKQEKLISQFYPPVSSTNKPNHFVDIHFVPEKRGIEVNDKYEEVSNVKPAWWDDSRPFTETHVQSLHVKELIEKVKKINGIAKMTDYTPCAKKLLTEACFTFKPLTKEQILLTYIILQKVTFEKASRILNDAFKEYPILKRKRVATCFRRTLKGELFNSKKTHRSCGYLGYIDSLILITEIDLKIAAGKQPDSDFVRMRACELYKRRMEEARTMYSLIRYAKKKSVDNSDDELDDEFSFMPDFSTDWVGKFIKRAGFIRVAGEKLERDRGIHCTASALIRWSLQFGRILESYAEDGRLLFNFDEAMIAVGGDATKFVARKGSQRPIQIKAADPQHLTVGCCFNAVGVKVPLFVILNQLQSLPAELEMYKSQDVFFSTQGNGWINKKLFYAWALMFCDWLNAYRKEIHHPDATVTLLLDSHNSRADSDVLELFKKCNVRLITFPPHCTHALQPFDVGVAKNLKYWYTKYYKEALNEREAIKLPSVAKRQIAIECIIRAWNHVLTPSAAECAFQKTGILPFNTGVMLMARGVNTISTLDPEKEERKTKDRLFISSSELTSDFMITYIKKWEIQVKSTKNAAKEEAKQSKSMIFSKLDPEVIITGYNTVKGDPEIKEPRFKGLQVMKPLKVENDTTFHNTLPLPSSLDCKTATPVQSPLISPAPTPFTSPTSKAPQKQQKSPQKRPNPSLRRDSPRIAKLCLPKETVVTAASQPVGE